LILQIPCRPAGDFLFLRSMEGVVVKSKGLWYQVETSIGETFDCRLKGKFKLKTTNITNPIAVGDRVLMMEDAGNAEAKIIYDILPRENYIIRLSPKKKGHSQIIAANIDLAIILATQKSPRTSLGFIDRFLVTAEAFRIPAAIVINKRDLLNSKEIEALSEKLKEYENLHYQTLIISSFEGNDLLKLKQLLYQKTSLLSGHSGVGKSTLINQLIPGIKQKTAEISSFADKGVHTTTFAERFRVADQSFIIDTPGIKELGLAEIEQNELSHYFPELREFLGKCRFNDCSHTHEPGCAMAVAYKQGKISQSRYESYLSMLMSEDNRR